MEKNIKKHEYKIGKLERQLLKKHNSFLIFFTGLSGSGKSTIANALEEKLNKLSVHTYTLDGDNMRFGLNKDLSFTPEDRTENIRRIGETAKLFIDAGVVTLAAFVAPYEKDRKNIEDTVKSDNFVEVFVNTSLEECERRDVKGLYKKARAGEIKNMTGISAPYEAPQNPTVEVSHLNTIEESVEIIFQAIKNKLEIKE
ncbi:adenylylsulfate kinase [Tamlana nanhaiensis]|uniref:Adenylyl-sulfate kinase n=1 Tax=Neotamlana nanhaiensis TaxID=1382798 RepID=A0A0D7W5X5_9FLAO|nr:adenylyl-sulfate kinase [Tamlana nanhaiensis]KJD34103.1 adenylylsulfate kinase [Tamlana nanhaiensis]